MWIPDSFFTALLSGRISSLKDENGAVFIDRDPKLFATILNYLRTRDIDLRNCDIKSLKHEAEYYGITPLVKRLVLCVDLNQSSCGDLLFYGYLPPPSTYIVYTRSSLTPPQWRRLPGWFILFQAISKAQDSYLFWVHTLSYPSLPRSISY